MGDVFNIMTLAVIETNGFQLNNSAVIWYTKLIVCHIRSGCLSIKSDSLLSV